MMLNRFHPLNIFTTSLPSSHRKYRIDFFTKIIYSFHVFSRRRMPSTKTQVLKKLTHPPVLGRALNFRHLDWQITPWKTEEIQAHQNWRKVFQLTFFSRRLGISINGFSTEHTPWETNQNTEVCQLWQCNAHAMGSTSDDQFTAEHIIYLRM